MTPEDVNKIIAEYMDLRGQWNGKEYVYKSYSDSLDALVPVWEKIYQIPGVTSKLSLRCLLDCARDILRWTSVSRSLEDLTPIQEAVSITTAQVIQELNNG